MDYDHVKKQLGYGIQTESKDNAIKAIEQLTARVRELEEENAKLHEQVDLQIPAIAFKKLTEQLAALKAENESMCKDQWVSVKDHLPDFNEFVLAGFWYEDTWVRDDHPEKMKFLMGICQIIESDKRDFPDGKQWHTFGPAHSQITHWMPLPKPPAMAQGEKE